MQWLLALLLTMALPAASTHGAEWMPLGAGGGPVVQVKRAVSLSISMDPSASRATGNGSEQEHSSGDHRH